MIPLLAQQAPEYNFWAKEPGNGALYWIFGAIILGIIAIIALIQVPTRARRPIVWIFTFLSGAFYVVYYLWPAPVHYKQDEMPQGVVDQGGFFLHDALPRVADIANVLTYLLLCLGIFSLVRIHSSKLFKKQKDWVFSAVLLGSALLMVTFGYWDYIQKEFNDPNKLLTKAENWSWVNYTSDLLFDGLIQQMDAAMFSIIAFFILSAAYRAFRIRSIEATVMMASAVILMMSLMGALDFLWTTTITNLAHGNEASFLNNFRLDIVAGWIKSYLQIPAIRALDFGVGLGALAMGLRIWLGLEKGGVSV